MNLYACIATVDFNLYLSSEASCELDPNNVINVKYFLKCVFISNLPGQTHIWCDVGVGCVLNLGELCH